MYQLKQLRRRRSISTLDITLFLRQFATLISANVTLIKSCELLEKNQEKIALRQLFHAIKCELLTGKNLSFCLSQHPRYFNELTCQLVKLGEYTGNLDVMLIKIAEHEEKRLAFKQHLQRILFYPLFVMAIALFITLLMLIFVVPRFAILFADLHTQLPLLTQCIFTLSYYIKFIMLFILLIASASFFYFRKAKIRYDRLWQRVPYLNTQMRKMALLHFIRHLACTLSAGISLTDALRLTMTTCSHQELRLHIMQIRQKVTTGMLLHRAMPADFPLLILQMTQVGEESGTLDLMLDKSADFLAVEINRWLDRLSQLLEPLIMLVLGVLIGGLVIGMYLPIFKLGNALS